MVIPCDFTQICRLCLVKDKVNVFLFDNNDTTKSILEKINSCLPVTVSENDNLPKKICDICLEKLNATYAFQNTTLNSEKQLLTWLAESSSKSASSINDVAIEVLPDTSIVKEEAPDPDIANELNEELHSQIEETEEPVPKRPRRSTALNRPVIEPDTEEDEDVDDVEPISKFESEDEDLEKLDIPSYLDPTTLADQPGPSGVGKESGEPTLNINYPPCHVSLLEIGPFLRKKKSDAYYIPKMLPLENLRCRICCRTFNGSKKLFFHKCLERTSRTYLCYACFVKFDNKTEMLKHKDYCYKTNIDVIKDQEKTFDSKKNVSKKNNTNYNKNSRDTEMSNTDVQSILLLDTQKKYYCTSCKKGFENLKECQNHLESHLEIIKGRLSNKNKNRKVEEEHSNDQHSLGTIPCCKFCFTGFQSQDDLNHHLQSQHPTLTIKEPISKSFNPDLVNSNASVPSLFCKPSNLNSFNTSAVLTPIYIIAKNQNLSAATAVKPAETSNFIKSVVSLSSYTNEKDLSSKTCEIQLISDVKERHLTNPSTSNIKINAEKIPDNIKTYTCELCFDVLKSQKEFQEHLEDHSNLR